MKAIVLLAALAAASALAVVACVTSSNRCFTGFEYSSQYDACLAVDAGTDAAPAADASSSAPDAALADDAGEAGAATADLGASCNATSDCSGLADYCLKSPLAPTSPGICTIPHCTSANCNGTYVCCDCSGAAIASLQAFPVGVCVGTSDGTQLSGLGCTCQ
jgi:hypothetical protein